MPDVSPVAVDSYHNKTDEGDDKWQVGGRDTEQCDVRVNNQSLKWREYRTTKDSHNETSSSKLDIVAYAA